MAAITAKPKVKVGGFLTNGSRLVEIRRVLTSGVTVEDAASPTSAPDVTTLTWDEIAEQGWRTVRKRALDGEYEARIEELLS